MLTRACVAATFAVASIACCSGKSGRDRAEEPARPAARTDRPREFSVRALGEPVRGARAWITALAPNARGGWNFITQTYEYPSSLPTELVVLDLATGRQHVTEGPPGIYANSNYQMGDLRAANGRVFFPALENHLYYYEPSSEVVKVLPRIVDGDDKAIYRMVFGPDGKLYGGTQSSGLPTVFVVDPDTLAVTVLGRVGQQRRGYSYAYYLAADPPWLYVAVGELPWELVAVNTQTKEHRLLATRADEGFIQFDHRPEGIQVTLISGLRTPRQRSEVMWAVDGKLLPSTARFKSRHVVPQHHPITGAPDLDLAAVNPDAGGVGRIRWREHASDWHEASFRVKHTVAVEIESLAPLADGTLLGNAKQYHAFFRYDPRTAALTRYEPLGLSGGPRLTLDSTTYLAGYPNGVLYAFDSTKPWSLPANPRLLGNFTEAGAHYAYFLVPARSGRIYYAGRRERDGVGGGVGSYDPATQRFAGHHDGLEMLDPQGLAVAGDRVIYSGRLVDGARGDAQLVVYDLELNERERLTIKPGLTNTGAIYVAPDARRLVGVVADARVLYQYDLGERRLIAWRELPEAIGPITRRDLDGSIWCVAGSELYRIDASTFEATRIGRLPETANGADVLVWLADRLYWASGSQLREITTP